MAEEAVEMRGQGFVLQVGMGRGVGVEPVGSHGEKWEILLEHLETAHENVRSLALHLVELAHLLAKEGGLTVLVPFGIEGGIAQEFIGREVLGQEILGTLGVLLRFAHLFHHLGNDVLAQRPLNAPRFEGEQEVELGIHEPMADGGFFEKHLRLCYQCRITTYALAMTEEGQHNAHQSTGLPCQMRGFGSGEQEAQAQRIKLVELRERDTAHEERQPQISILAVGFPHGKGGIEVGSRPLLGGPSHFEELARRTAHRIVVGKTRRYAHALEHAVNAGIVCIGRGKALGAVEHIGELVRLADKLLGHSFAVGVGHAFHEEGKQSIVRLAQFFEARIHLPLAEHFGKGAQGFNGAYKLSIGQSRKGIFAQGGIGGWVHRL